MPGSRLKEEDVHIGHKVVNLQLKPQPTSASRAAAGESIASEADALSLLDDFL